MAGTHVENSPITPADTTTQAAEAPLVEKPDIFANIFEEALAAADRHAAALAAQDKDIADAFWQTSWSVREEEDCEQDEPDINLNTLTVESIYHDGDYRFSIPDLTDVIDKKMEGGDVVVLEREFAPEDPTVWGARPTLLSVQLERREDGIGVHGRDVLETYREIQDLFAGTLRIVEDDELGKRLVYQQDPDTFIHPNVLGRTEKSLEQLAQTIAVGKPMRQLPQ